MFAVEFPNVLQKLYRHIIYLGSRNNSKEFTEFKEHFKTRIGLNLKKDAKFIKRN